MNIQIGDHGINWTDATWNPVKGCKHNCPYCYARAFAELYADGNFEPSFHPHLLDEPMRRKKPTKIFVGSNADVFGDWVPEEWVHAILRTVRQCPQHTFQFLTKAPHNLAKYNPWPDNCWVGATATNQAMMDKARSALRACQAPVRYVSSEPLLDAIVGELDPLDWLIIGAQTGRGAHQPERSLTTDLIAAARASGLNVWFKENLTLTPRINEWPEAAAAHKVGPSADPTPTFSQGRLQI